MRAFIINCDRGHQTCSIFFYLVLDGALSYGKEDRGVGQDLFTWTVFGVGCFHRVPSLVEDPCIDHIDSYQRDSSRWKIRIGWFTDLEALARFSSVLEIRALRILIRYICWGRVHDLVRLPILGGRGWRPYIFISGRPRSARSISC